MFRSSRVPELAQRPALQLADTVFAHTERYSNLFLCMFPVVRSHSEAHPDETLFSGRQCEQDIAYMRVQQLAIKLVFVVRFHLDPAFPRHSSVRLTIILFQLTRLRATFPVFRRRPFFVRGVRG